MLGEQRLAKADGKIGHIEIKRTYRYRSRT